MLGKTISHYKILEKLGEGGMGVVYKAQDIKLDRLLALKFLPPHLVASEAEKARFLQEAKSASALNHPNVCVIHDIQEYEGQQFIVMEYVDGATLRKKFESKPLTVNEAISYAIQIGEALKEAHSQGIVHRDVKSDNIMINSKNQVKVMDFGLAKLKGSLKLTKTSSTVGTLAYMSPEQIQGGEVDVRSDIFSFGIVLYEMLAGQLPFRGEHEAAMMYSIVNEEPEPIQKYLPDAPSDLVHIFNRLLEKTPDDRYQSMADVVIELRRLKRDTSRVHRVPEATMSQPLPTEPKNSPRPRFFRKNLIWLVGLAVLVIGAVVVIYLLHPFKASKSVVKRVIVVPFENKTGDPSLNSLGRMVADWTTQSLLQTGLAEVVPPEKVPELEKLKNVRSIAKATGASTIVMGSYYKLGDTIQFQAKILDANEKLLVAIDPVSSPVAKTMDGVEAVRQRVLGALAMVLDKRLEGWVKLGSKPPSYEAYQQYMQGFDLFLKQFDYPGAIEYFKRAYAIDTSFIQPLYFTCAAYANLGQLAQVDSLVRFLNLRRAQLTPLQQLGLDRISSWVSGDRMKSLNATREAVKIAPGFVYAYDWGYDAFLVNRPKEAIEAFKMADQEQQWIPYWNYFTASYHVLGEHKKELEIARQSRKRYPTSLYTLGYEIRAFAAMGKMEEIKKLLEESLTFPKLATYDPGGLMRRVAEELRAHGYRDVAMTIFDQAIQWYRSRPAEEMDSLRRYDYGLTLYDSRRWEEAKSIFEELAKKSPDNIEYQGYLGFIAARQGDREKALKVSEWLKNLKKPYLFGEHTFYRACIAAILGEKDQAVTLLKDSFLQGFTYSLDIHRDFDFESLWDYPPFKELLKPKG
ncbi:MAG: serine/threonine-protein kinase [candidate division Zixibacteria bacterium]|nr:serine/threonine-protein kinase [candidate division Zixibacteria bacterium]